jgi:hypothetical protein
MPIRYYSSLDAGSPVLSGGLYERVRTVMLACLVNGYGAKEAAGWELVHDVTGGFSLSNGDGIINWVRNAAVEYVGVYIMEAVTDISTPLAGGVNRRSAGWADDASSERAYFYQAGGFNSGSNPHWSVVADEKTVIFYAGSGGSASPGVWGTGFAHYFGAYVNALGLSGVATFCSLGNGIGSHSTYALARQDRRYGNCLRNPETGLIDQGVARYGASPAIHWRAITATAVPALAPSRLSPVRAALFAHGGTFAGTSPAAASVVGYLRGLISEPSLSGADFSDVCRLFGKPNVWQSRVKVLDLPGGHQWVPIFPHKDDLGYFASLDPADWG